MNYRTFEYEFPFSKKHPELIIFLLTLFVLNWEQQEIGLAQTGKTAVSENKNYTMLYTKSQVDFDNTFGPGKCNCGKDHSSKIFYYTEKAWRSGPLKRIKNKDDECHDFLDQRGVEMSEVTFNKEKTFWCLKSRKQLKRNPGSLSKLQLYNKVPANISARCLKLVEKNRFNELKGWMERRRLEIHHPSIRKGVKIVASELKPCVFWFNVPNMEKSGTQMVIELNLKFFCCLFVKALK